MNKEKDLEFFKKLKYDVVMKKRGNLFVLFVPELACIEEDESLEKAYEKLEMEKESYFRKMIESGYQDHIREPEGAKRKKRFVDTVATNVLSFFVKSLIVLLIGGIFIQVASYKYQGESNIFKKIKQISRIINHLDEIGGTVSGIVSVPEAEGRKKEIKLKLRETAKVLEPFIDEFKILSEDTTKQGTKKVIKKTP